MNTLMFQFNIIELAALFGLAHSIYILVYMIFRSGSAIRAVLPVIFFLNLGAALLLSAAYSRWHPVLPYYDDLQWAVWALCAPLTVLLIVQIINITKTPSIFFWFVLCLVPISYISAEYLGVLYGSEAIWLHINGVITGALSLLILWFNRDRLHGLYKKKEGQERFWLVITLLILNVAILSINLLQVNQIVSVLDADMIRTILGISFVYVASTSLLRIYPQAVHIVSKSGRNDASLSKTDIETALKIEALLYTDKVYQEASYGRSDMAQELSLNEANLSKIVSLYFKKSVPQLLNELRVAEAKVFLVETEESIAAVSEEAGFNSLATFNRVFKGIEGVSPSEYREMKK